MDTTTHTRLSDQTVLHRREFAAPAAVVQRAHTDPTLFARWMGPAGTVVDLQRFSPTTGGCFRYVVRTPDGSGAWAFRGSYHEVSPGRIVHTWEFEDEPGPTLEILTFTDLPMGRSALEVLSTHTSPGMEDQLAGVSMDDPAMDENFLRLDLVLRGA